MRPILAQSPAARSALDAYRREQAPSPAALRRARGALADRLQLERTLGEGGRTEARDVSAPEQKDVGHGSAGSRGPRPSTRWSALKKVFSLLTVGVGVGGLLWTQSQAPVSAPSATRLAKSAALAAPTQDGLPGAAAPLPALPPRGVAPALASESGLANPPVGPVATSISRRAVRHVASDTTRPAGHPQTKSAVPPVSSAATARDEPLDESRANAMRSKRREEPRASTPPAAVQAVPAPAAQHELASPSLSSRTVHVARREPERAPSGLDQEVVHVRKAYDLLRAGEPLRALSALGEHARLFPEGELREPREVARIVALCELGRVDTARAVAARFARDYPRSLHAARVSATCAAAQSN